MLASMMLGLWMADAMATPTITDCDGNVPDPGYAFLTCQSMCNVFPAPGVPGGFSVDCNLADAGAVHDPFALAVSNVGPAEFVILGNATEATFGQPAWCCRVDDDAFEVVDVALSGTQQDDEVFFACPVAATYTACSGSFALSNPNPTSTTLLTGRFNAVSGGVSPQIEDRIYGSTSTHPAYLDMLFGSASRDTIYGFGGNDLIFGLGADDVLYGGEGNDQIHGGDGGDVMKGDEGNDTLFGDASVGVSGIDYFIGNIGADWFCDDDGGVADKFDGDPSTSSSVDVAEVQGPILSGSHMDGPTNECNVSGAVLPGCSTAVTLPVCTAPH